MGAGPPQQDVTPPAAIPVDDDADTTAAIPAPTAIDDADSDATPPFPWVAVALVAAINLCNTAAYLMTAPFVPFMVMSFTGCALADAGLYTGLLEGSFHVGSVFGAIIWGYVADQYGRRPALLFGLLGTIAATIAFGVAPTLMWAMVARFAWGALNGNVGVAKTSLSELCADKHSARAFSYIGLNTGLGRLIGPFLGGVLSEPVRKYGWASPLLAAYPYLLPCLISAALTTLLLVVCFFLLNETIHLSFPQHAARPAAYQRLGREEAEEPHEAGGEEAGGAREESCVDTVTLTQEKEGSPSGEALFVAAAGAGVVAAPPPPPVAAATIDSCSSATTSTWLQLACDGPVVATVALYSALGFVALISVELHPLYVVNDAEHGGFSLDSSALGFLAFSAGAPLLLFQAFVFERLTKWIGVLTMQRASLALFAVLVATTPLESLVIGQPEAVVWTVLVAHFWVISVVRVACFISCFVLVANAALPADRSRVNALGQACVSLVRAFGPPLATPIFAWSVSDVSRPWPLNYHFTWLLCAVLVAGTWAIAARLPASLERKRRAA